LFKKYITNQNEKGKGYAFEDLILDCVKKMTQTAEREGGNLSTEGESVASTSTARTEPSCKQLPVADVFHLLQGRLKIHEMVYVPLSEKERYEGRLTSNAHSEISRERDHVFKQTKVGSKVQYFSYKLTQSPCRSIHFSQCKTSLRMQSLKNSGVLCLIHDVTACFTSSS
jgi:hypothetical protein